MDRLYKKTSFATGRLITNLYSTSFSSGVKSLGRDVQDAIYAVYGFVRLADEIVDTFHEFDKSVLIEEFEREYYCSLERGISLNPAINAFQLTVKEYSIPNDLVQAFLKSMKSDISEHSYDEEGIRAYIYGSADVVGLMCLKIFTHGQEGLYDSLKTSAMRLGSAFQKVNFLRDIKNDTENLSRCYFPILKERELDEEAKRVIISDILSDFDVAIIGIRSLPKSCRFGVFLAYKYYRRLTYKICSTSAKELSSSRVRVSGLGKLVVYLKALVLYKTNLYKILK